MGDECCLYNASCRSSYELETEYVYANGIVSRSDWSQGYRYSWKNRTEYYHTGFHGSVMMTSGESGLMTERYHYDAFGNNYAGSLAGHNTLGYGGKRYDPATGLYDYGFRDYDTRTGRFTTVDPVRDGMNWYAYCNNDPVNFFDLWGLCAVQDKAANNTNSDNSIAPDEGEDEPSIIHILREIEGYPENGNTEWRAYNDQVFIDACDSYNNKYNLAEGDDGYITPRQIKAWAMVESGGSGDKDSFLSDPLQVNNPDDWDDRKRDICGLEQNQEMTPEISTSAALEWRHYKGYIHDSSGAETEWRGDWEAFRRYNGNANPPPANANTLRTQHRDYYADKVLELGGN